MLQNTCNFQQMRFMRKVILILSICLLFIACSKSNSNNVCWNCKIFCGVGPFVFRDTVVCDGNNDRPPTIRDSQGNDCSMKDCKKQ